MISIEENIGQKSTRFNLCITEEPNHYRVYDVKKIANRLIDDGYLEQVELIVQQYKSSGTTTGSGDIAITLSPENEKIFMEHLSRIYYHENSPENIADEY